MRDIPVEVINGRIKRADVPKDARVNAFRLGHAPIRNQFIEFPNRKSHERGRSLAADEAGLKGQRDGEWFSRFARQGGFSSGWINRLSRREWTAGVNVRDTPDVV
ncbi:hypothetical protein T281_03870 [Rhodomicrobium udaipurense JA643]|nr:hypothetical protein T281_03870 [Rhodomicrobium udaipurense JA643]